MGKEKKTDNTEVKKTINSLLADKSSDDPDTILKNDKKLYSSVLVAIIALTVLSALISIIIGFASGSLVAGFTALFVGAISSAVLLLLVTVFINMAHNQSRSTRAMMILAKKLEDILDASSEYEEDNQDDKSVIENKGKKESK